MPGTVDELNMVITRLAEIDALERAVDGQNFLGLIVGQGPKIFCLSLGEADHSRGWRMNIKLG